MLCVLGKGEPCFPPSYSSSRWQHGWLPSVDQGQRSSSCHVWRNADPPYRRFSSLSPKRRKKRPDAGVHGGGWGCFGLKWLLISLAGVWFTAPAKVDSVLVGGGGGCGAVTSASAVGTIEIITDHQRVEVEDQPATRARCRSENSDHPSIDELLTRLH